MEIEWLPIETAPKDGTRIVCFGGPNIEKPCFLCWKTNQRIVDAKKEKGRWTLEYSDSYFGDPSESDDVELAHKYGGPTHWHPLAPVPRDDC